VAALAAASGVPAQALAAAQIGQTFPPVTACGGASTYLQTTSPGGQYAAPSPGVITAWSFQAGATPPAQIKLKVARPAGVNLYTIVGDSPLESPAASQLNTYTDVRIPLQAGDLLGRFVPPPSGGTCAVGAGAAYGYSFAPSDPPPGTTTTFTFDGNAQFDLSAVLEPDSDNDGFGDETQDCAPADPSKQDDCSPPETTITKHPKDKTKKRKATFEFSSTEPGSTFACSLDGAVFATCTSPATFKVKRSRHSFAVRATDAAGNFDTSPATDDWKVKKKKKRH
jgi:hypothetical protein